MSVQQSSSLLKLHRLARSRTASKGVLRQWLEMIALFVFHGNGPNFYQMAGFWQTGQRWSVMTPAFVVSTIQGARRCAQPAAVPETVTEQGRREGDSHADGDTDTAVPRSARSRARSRHVGSSTPRRERPRATRVSRRFQSSLFQAPRGLRRQGLCGGRCSAQRVRGSLQGAAAIRPHEWPARVRLHQTEVPYSALDLIARLGDEPRLIEVYLDQHPAYAAFNASSVNTLRIWVLRRAGKVNTRFAYLRIGRAGSLIDNRVSGGIVALLDVRTGACPKRWMASRRASGFPCIPTTGHDRGVVLPMVGEAMRSPNDA